MSRSGEKENAMPVAKVNGTDLYYELRGSGPTIVFIHGENHGIEMFERQVAHFSSDYQCLTYYRRAHGQSAAPPYGYSLWNQTLDLQYLLEELDLNPVSLIAVGMGCPIAVMYARHNETRVTSIVLSTWYELDGYPKLESRRRAASPFPELQLQMYQIGRQTGQRGLEEYMQRNAKREFPILPDDPRLRAELITMFTSHPPERYLHAAEFYTSLPNTVPDLLQLTCPVLGVCGENDPSPDRPELAAGMRNFRQAWIPSSRRFPLIEQPETFNHVVAEFLAANTVNTPN